MDPNPISEEFERAFLEVPLEAQIRHCPRYELAGLFERRLPAHQPILEAGCGSGRWVAWFAQHGWKATGLDWSETLCARARAQIPGASFVAGDMRAMPFPGDAFGAIVSLGAVEHDVAGPRVALTEYARVLRPGGIAILTVPYLGCVTRAVRLGKAALRRLAGRNPPARRAARKAANPAWACDLMPHGDEWTFFQYLFTAAQFRPLLAEAGFEVLEEFPAFQPEGILHGFGRLAGRYDHEAAQAVFTPLGRMLAALLSASSIGLMLCCVVRKGGRSGGGG